MDSGSSEIRWTITTRILSSPVLVKQILLGILISSFLPVFVLFVIELLDPYSRLSPSFLQVLVHVFLIVLGILTGCVLIGVLLVMGNRYEHEYSADDKGIVEKAAKKQYRRNTIVNGLLVGLGLLMKQPGAAGAGVLAQSRQAQYLKWKDVDGYSVDPHRRTIVLIRGRRVRMIVYCLPENYDSVAERVSKKIRQYGKG